MQEEKDDLRRFASLIPIPGERWCLKRNESRPNGGVFGNNTVHHALRFGEPDAGTHYASVADNRVVFVISVMRGKLTQRVSVLCVLDGRVAWVRWEQFSCVWVRLSPRPDDRQDDTRARDRSRGDIVSR